MKITNPHDWIQWTGTAALLTYAVVLAYHDRTALAFMTLAWPVAIWAMVRS